MSTYNWYYDCRTGTLYQPETTTCGENLQVKFGEGFLRVFYPYYYERRVPPPPQ